MHLDSHLHAYTDENNIVVNIVVFDESAHDSDLLEDIRQANGWNEVVCCCTFGAAHIGDTWTGTQFVPVSPYPSWIWNDTSKEWEAPTPRPIDDIYEWDEENLVWVKLDFFAEEA